VRRRRSHRRGSRLSTFQAGLIGIVLIALISYGVYTKFANPFASSFTIRATFANANGLNIGSPVRIAGVNVGKVQNVSLIGDKGLVKATFTVKNGWVGDQSIVEIKLKTLLGAKYLNIDSIGTKKQDAGKTIPVSRTRSPLDVYPAFTELTRTIQQLNTDQLAKAFQTLAQDFTGTPAYVRSAVTGLSRLSQTIASRNDQLGQLLSAANAVTGTLADRDADLTQLLQKGNLLLQELNARRDAIHSLLINTQLLSEQLRGLVADNQQTIKPLLNNLDKVLTLLNSNQETLDRGLSLLGPFYRVFTNVIGNGRWFDNYIQDLSANGLLCLLKVVNNC
jgi:phospholipid/cholesterol/gamma-HCH transport system substrate-binding protein